MNNDDLPLGPSSAAESGEPDHHIGWADGVDKKHRFGKHTGAAVMASDHANAPPALADQDRLRSCEKCSGDMKQLGQLPALSIHAAVKVFRCYRCDHVVAERT
jgi:hypothetical protein